MKTDDVCGLTINLNNQVNYRIDRIFLGVGGDVGKVEASLPPPQYEFCYMYTSYIYLFLK